MLVGILVAAAVTVALLPPLIRLLTRRQVLDVPSDRSSHVHPTPRGGGLAPALGALAGLAAAGSWSPARTGLLVAGAAFALVGLTEDLRGVPPLPRLALQALGAAAAAPWVVDATGADGSTVALVALAVVVWPVAFANVFNFMDGIDGLAALQATVVGATAWVVGATQDLATVELGGAILVVVALCFAPANLPTARVFLGDVGSYFLGAWIAVLAVLGVAAALPPEVALAPLAVCVVDTGATLARRLRRGERWDQAHREHVYQRLIAGGWSHARTSAFVAASATACAALGTVGLYAGTTARVLADIAIVAVLGAYLLMPTLARQDHARD